MFAMDGVDALLPGIQDDITIQLIVPKLPFGSFAILSWVSHAWRSAIQHRQIYDARVRCNSTKSLATFLSIKRTQIHQEKCILSLCSIGNNYSFQLPPIPMVEGERRRDFGFVSLAGRIYLLGGGVISYRRRDIFQALSEVYVMDVAGMDLRWKRCASMGGLRAKFASCVSGGKVYVFGGWSVDFRKDIVFQQQPEVYDPESDTWSPIKMNPLVRESDVNVLAIGEELVVYNSTSFPARGFFHAGQNIIRTFCEIYNPRKDEWRTMQDFCLGSRREFGRKGMVVVDGKLQRLERDCIYDYDMLANVWNHSQSSSFGDLESGLGGQLFPRRIVALNGELLLAGVMCSGNLSEQRPIFLVSRGLGSKGKKVLWHEVSQFFSPDFPDELLSSIQF